MVVLSFVAAATAYFAFVHDRSSLHYALQFIAADEAAPGPSTDDVAVQPNPRDLCAFPQHAAPLLFNVSPDVFWPKGTEASGFVKWRDESNEWNDTCGDLARDEEGHLYPLSARHFVRGFTAPNASWGCVWGHLSKAFAAKIPIRLGIIGGSMTMGHDWARGWPVFLTEWLTVRGWAGTVTVDNLAVPATSARQHADSRCGEFNGYDGYIIDTGVNTVTESSRPAVQEGLSRLIACLVQKQATTAALPAPLPPALLYVGAVDIIPYDCTKSCRGCCPLCVVVPEHQQPPRVLWNVRVGIHPCPLPETHRPRSLNAEMRSTVGLPRLRSPSSP